jgi:uncharacterized protein (TIGR02246 family)
MARVRPPPASSDDIENQFYEALQMGDLERLMSVWADDDDIACVHPGGPRIIGPVAIRSSFDTIFSNGTINVQPERVRRLLTQDSAIHHVLEKVQMMTADGPRSAWVVATNVYVKTALGWRLVLHHASPGSPDEAQDISESPAVLH